MSELKDMLDLDEFITDGPQSALERNLLEEYLHGKGLSLKDVQKLPKEEAKQLMTEACTYVSLKLAEIESRAHFREEIRPPT